MSTITGRLPELLAATHLGNGSLLLEWTSAASGWQPQTVTVRLQVTSVWPLELATISALVLEKVPSEGL